jgi:zinc transport system substrate-binding protein
VLFSALARLGFACLVVAALAPPALADSGPRVVASIKPLQSLAAGVMGDLGTPAAIVHDAGSPHTYVMRPSEARALAEAQLVVWVGPVYEGFLAKPIAALGDRARVLTLLDAPGIEVLPARGGGVWAHENGVDTTSTESGGVDVRPHAQLAEAAEADPHLFLDPHNAIAIVRDIADALAKLDPAHGAAYEKNAAATVARLQALDTELTRNLAPVRATPYVVFHDGEQYLERHYGLNGVGSVVVSPERPPGARRLAEIRERIRTLHAACVFAEPQFDSALVRTVAEGTDVRTGVLDYIGVDLKPGPDAYFDMMRGLGRSFAGCLSSAASNAH